MTYKIDEKDPRSRSNELYSSFMYSFEEDLWRGNLNGRVGSVKAFEINFEARLYTTNCILDGSGRAFGPARKFVGKGFDLIGNISSQECSIKMFFDLKFMNGKPFNLTGKLHKTEGSIKKITGDFSICCFSGCGCGGGEGDFVMFRDSRQNL